MTDLRSRAIAAREELLASQRVEEAANAAREHELDVQKLRTAISHHPWTGIDPDSVNDTKHEFQGMVFCLGKWDGRRYGLRLIGTCPRCQGETFSDTICSLIDLGDIIADKFRPHYSHECRYSAPLQVTTEEPSTGQRLVDLIREIIREEGGAL